MAREYAKLLTRIWADSEFKGLSGNTQRLYFQIISQPDISMAGVVTLAPTRWSLQVGDQDKVCIEQCLSELESKRFVIIDRSSQEVLVRSFVRSDGGWKSPTTMIGIDSSVRAILSDGLKAAVRDEFSRIDTSKLSVKVSEKTGKSTRDVVEGIMQGIQDDFDGLNESLICPSDTPTDTPSDALSDTPWHGHNEIPHSTATETEPATEPEPEPETRKSGADNAPRGAHYPDEFLDFWDQYPLKRDKGKALKAWKNAIKRTDNDAIIAGAIRYRDDPNRDDQYTKYAEGWLNGDGWEDEPLPDRARPSGRDLPRNSAQERMDRNRAVIENLRRIEESYGDQPIQGELL